MNNEVRLISISQSPDHSPEELITYCARVSNPSNQNNSKTAKGLVKYLVREGHWSPFEMVSLTMEIVTTRDIARQILRHRSFSFQEFSQRYADPTDDLSFLIREGRLQDTKNRQNSIPNEDAKLEDAWQNKQLAVIETVRTVYKWALEHGIAKEQARAVLPEGNTYSKLYMAGTLRSWIHYVGLRISNGTQLEHSDVASLAWVVIKEHFPNVANAVEELGIVKQ
jgi:thymidylate synthase (FAD)